MVKKIQRYNSFGNRYYVWSGDVSFLINNTVENITSSEKGYKIMSKEFKVNDLVEVPMWTKAMRRDWIIIDIVSNGGGAIIRNIFS